MSESYFGKAQVRVEGGEWVDVDDLQWRSIPREPDPNDPSRFTVYVRRQLTVPLDMILLTVEIELPEGRRRRLVSHVRRDCGPGGHKNSKASRRLLRALNGCA